MNQTNLSTRPFYNERLVHTVLALLAAAVVVVTAVNVRAVLTLSRRDAALGTATSQAERAADVSRRNAARVRRSLNAVELQTVSAAASEANTLIDRRTFSWTRLLADFEAALPPEVRVASVQPHVDKEGGMTVTLLVVARQAEDINAFAEKLEARGAFENIMFRQESVNQEGLLETTMEGRYIGKARAAGKAR
jgi:hypothetical protein